MGAKRHLHSIDRDWYDSAAKMIPARTKSANLLENKVTSAADIPELLSPKDVARILKLNEKTASRMMKAQEIRSTKIGGKRISTPEWVADYMRKEFAKNG